MSITIKVTPTSAAMAKTRLLYPRKARMIKMSFTSIAPIVFNLMTLKVLLPNRIRKGNKESLSFIKAIFAVSMAVSLPAAPMAIPTDD